MSNQQQQGFAPSYAAPVGLQASLSDMNQQQMGNGMNATVPTTFQQNPNGLPPMYLNPYAGSNSVQHYQPHQLMPQYASPTGNTSAPGSPVPNYPGASTAPNNNMQAAMYSIPSNWNGVSGMAGVPGAFCQAGTPTATDNSKAVFPVVTTSTEIHRDVMSIQETELDDFAFHSRGDGDSDSSKSSGPTDKVKQNRDRNREHARSTRLRKKAYVQKLKEMADGLRAVQTEEIRQRRLAVHAMTTTQKSRKRIVHKFLSYHADFEADPKLWGSIVEEGCWLKQPVTPFRSFRRSEVESDCRIVRGLDSLINEAASLSTMIERIGSRNARWQRIKRGQFERHLEQSGIRLRPIESNQRVESSLSSSSGTDSSDDSMSQLGNTKKVMLSSSVPSSSANKVSSSSGNDSKISRKRGRENDAKDDSVSDDAPTEAQLSTSSETEPEPNLPRPGRLPSNIARSAEIDHTSSTLPRNIARSGGIVHNVTPTILPAQPLSSNKNRKVVSLVEPPRPPIKVVELKERDIGDIGAYYAINDDDMIIIDDVLMCPFVFRTRNAVMSGALADCVMPGMIRANFSKANKLQSIEMVYDAMGFMQQLDGADGGQMTAQVIPGSLEMALMSAPKEARVITEARPPYAVVHVNEAWTKLTKYSQLDVEGEGLLGLIECPQTHHSAKARPGRPRHLLEEVAQGRSACSTNLHRDKAGNIFVDFMCSYPLTNSEDKISHILHVNLELKDHALI